ncbi:MAG: hypothetical protein RRY47_00040, partial [Oscillospiraceae bacterium]
ATLAAAAKQLEDGKALIAEFEAGQAQVDAGYATVKENPEVLKRIEGGMDPIEAGRAEVDAQTVITTKDLTGRLFLYLGAILAALVGIVAAILGFGAATTPSIGKIKGGIILGALALLVGAAANVYGFMNAYTAFPMQMYAIIAVAVFALLYVVAIFRYKNALVAMMTAA